MGRLPNARIRWNAPSAWPDRSSVIVGSPETAGWNRQGCPFYAEGVAYRQSFDVANLAGRYLVSLPAWYGAVARIHVNGKQAGQISVRPWQCDVTRSSQPGRNTIEVVVDIRSCLKLASADVLLQKAQATDAGATLLNRLRAIGVKPHKSMSVW